MKDSNRLTLFDILKFILACGIVCHHYQQLTEVQFSRLNFYGGDFDVGCFVELFFMISGFLVIYSMGAHPDVMFREYIADKLIRIYPMAITATVVTAMIELLYHRLYQEWYAGIMASPFAFFQSASLSFFGGAFLSRRGIVSPLWYLCVLLYSYVWFFFIRWLCERMQIPVVYGYGIAVLIGTGCMQYDIRLPYLNGEAGRGYSAFFVGTCLFFLWKSVKQRFLTMYSVFVLCITGAAFFMNRELYRVEQRDTLTYIVFPAILLLTLTLQERLRGGAIAAILAKHAGRMSYELYLWHFGGLILLDILRRQNQIDITRRLTMAGFLLIMCVFSYVIGALIERPLTERLKRHEWTGADI